MRSPTELLRAIVVCVSLVTAVTPARAVTAEEVRHAASETARDPNLGRSHKEKVLRLRSDDAPKKQQDAKAWQWLIDLIRWISETGRLLVWLAGAVLVAVLVVGLRRWILVRGEALAPALAPAPTHVQGLDIRAESLPPAIGAAAARLWQAGDHRAALSLLYRGALSRLVHRHAVPVRGSSTEAECVQLARTRLDEERGAFFARLVQIWQTAVYGARMPQGDAVAEVCRTFDALWPGEPGAAA